MWLESIQESEGHAERCPTCRGSVQRRSHGEMHAGSFILDGQRVDIRRFVAPGHADPIVLDALTQYFDGGLYRMWASERYLSRGGKRLHQDVWRSGFGTIPDGCHIHHRDDDKFNNALSNLECLPAGKHLSDTWRKNKSGYTSGQHFSDHAREKAAEWHRSEAGKLWHKRHAKSSKSWTKWKREPAICPECNSTFDCLIRQNAHAQIYCGGVCKHAAYRKRQKLERAARRVVSDSS